jgi:hypothetical protein
MLKTYVEIHGELYVLYNQNVMREGVVRQWCRMFKDGQTNVHNEERSGHLSNDLVRSVDQKLYERWCFTISELSCEFPHIYTVLYDITTIKLGYLQVLCKMGSKHAHGCAQNSLTFLDPYHKYGNKFLSHIV